LARKQHDIRDEKRTVRELTDFQVRWRYERIVICWLDMLKHFNALKEGAPDPKLRRAAEEAWNAIGRTIVGLRERFRLAWVDSEEYAKEFEEELREELREEVRPKPPLGKTEEYVSYLCHECGFYTNSYDEVKAHYEETAHTSFSKQTVVEEPVRVGNPRARPKARQDPTNLRGDHENCQKGKVTP